MLLLLAQEEKHYRLSKTDWWVWYLEKESGIWAKKNYRYNQRNRACLDDWPQNLVFAFWRRCGLVGFIERWPATHTGMACSQMWSSCDKKWYLKVSVHGLNLQKDVHSTRTSYCSKWRNSSASLSFSRMKRHCRMTTDMKIYCGEERPEHESEAIN